MGLVDTFDIALSKVAKQGLMLSTEVGSPALASMFFGLTTRKSNSEVLERALEKKEYGVLDVLLTKGADVGSSVHPSRTVEFTAAALDKVREAGQTDPSLAEKHRSYIDRKSTAVTNRILGKAPTA